jgi:hypothetical protein
VLLGAGHTAAYTFAAMQAEVTRMLESYRR